MGKCFFVVFKKNRALEVLLDLLPLALPIKLVAINATVKLRLNGMWRYSVHEIACTHRSGDCAK